MEELAYSDEGVISRYFFFEGVNKLDVFVEDVGKEYEYETILKKLFGEKYKISEIFPLGGKNNVIKTLDEFIENGKIDSEIPKIFIVDGDFDKYLDNIEVKEHPNLVYLEKYNIENYYVDKKATVSFMKGKLEKLDKKVEEIIKFEEWLEETVNDLKPIFILYCIIQENELGIPNVGESEYRIFEDLSGKVISQVYDSLKLKVEKELPNVSELERIMEEKYLKENSDFFDLICGKHLLCSLFLHLKSCGKGFRRDDLEWHLKQNIDISKLDFLKQRVETLV